MKVDEELVANTLMLLRSYRQTGVYPVHTVNLIQRWEAALAADQQITDVVAKEVEEKPYDYGISYKFTPDPLFPDGTFKQSVDNPEAGVDK